MDKSELRKVGSHASVSRAVATVGVGRPDRDESTRLDIRFGSAWMTVSAAGSRLTLRRRSPS